ncbi:uncharacterized protein CANTADRAFT_57953 [Suhomyces tanzawaensis NRRL Y-17324]|uniref:F-box domain-containing protein n=1 Tax=Suhomyces tanzawaensis NRRL Y-17324 TaxID=984487 RepID=A0A1E4SAY6_9ASCO|nr:uncharacterized protein CANTADRAFT_57953 [Suhomyces tanzawaensis NRRL Y-17324]ODV76687.1 hypothetical protein CANTADRAFT_57953 [Suhomyces tanzawaensis NRRL Y-17324]
MITWLLPELPEEVLQIILDNLDQRHLANLAQVSRFLRKKACERLYKKIIVINDDIEGNFLDQCRSSYLRVSRLNLLVDRLSPENFARMTKIIIHSQSNLISYDYFPLYERLLRLWDLVPHHSITFMNFDINNIRNSRTINQYVSNRSTLFIEDELMNLHNNSKVSNLRNWMVFDFRELFELPYNLNLQDLDIFIEQSMGPAAYPDHAPDAFLHNLSTLSGLYLDSPTSTSQFLQYFKGSTAPIMHNLEKLSLTSAHSYKDNSRLSFSDLSKVIDFRTLKKFELKINCIHNDCDCINTFFSELPCNNLQKFILINYKSNNLKQNLNQFDRLLNNPDFFRAVSTVESLYLNVNDFIKLDANHSPKFSIRKLMLRISGLTRLRELVIPDFFNNWLVSLPSIFEHPRTTEAGYEPENCFDLLLNKCSCVECNSTRARFNKLASFDSRNNYKHDFKRSLPSSSGLADAYNNTEHLIEFTTSNVNFLNYLVANLKRQFIYINENLFSINSVINSNEKPFIVNPELIPYNKLFMHSCLNHFVGRIKYDKLDLKLINLGGIVIEFTKQNCIKAPYNV